MLTWASQKELVRTMWMSSRLRDALRGVLAPSHFEREDLGWIVKILMEQQTGAPYTANEIREKFANAAPHIVAACESLLPVLESAAMQDVDRAIESGRKFAAYQEAVTLSGQLVTLAQTGQWGAIRSRTEELLKLSGGVEEAEGDDLVVSKASAVAAERVQWLWEGYIPVSKISTVEGDGGLGKSTIMLDIAARVTTGSSMPFNPVMVDVATGLVVASNEPADVVVLSAEDGVADTIRPRLEAAGADLDRVHIVSGVRERGSGEDRSTTERGIALDRDVLRLESLVMKTGAKLVIIDPIVAMLGGTVDFHRDQDVRRVLKALAGMAERRKCAVVTIRHLNKDSGTKTLNYRGSGSIGFVSAVRVAMMVIKHPVSEPDRIVAVYKTNLSVPPSPVIYRFKDVPETGAARIEWGSVSNMTIQELAGGTP